MYAIVEIAGKQFKVYDKDALSTPLLKVNPGDTVTFDRVLLIEHEDQISVGTPTVSGASVSCKVLEHSLDDKVLVFKKKRRKGYQKMQGHRQGYSRVIVEEIIR